MQQASSPEPTGRFVRQASEEEIGEHHITVPPARPHRVPRKNLGSPYILMGGFALLIAVGTILLLLPFTNTTGGITPFNDALFTATSAATVTGLVVVETSTYWTFYGQLIIMILIFTGGLGIMTTATFLLITIGQRITLANRLLMRETLGASRVEGLATLSRRIVLLVVAIQIIGFILLLIRLMNEYPLWTAIWQSAFHSVSGFNNAGFAIFPESHSLSAFRGDFGLLLPMMLLIIAGTLSFSVMLDIGGYRRFNRFTLDSKLVVTATALILFLGAIVIMVAEFGNSSTLGELPLGTKILNAIFHSASGRTAGFTTVDFGSMEQHSNFFIIGMMFIGGASASTAGGIKVNTFAVLVAAALSSMGGKTHASAFGREIPQPQVYRALTVLLLGMGVVFGVAFFLTISEGFPFIQILFETVSAFATVGLSTGITPELSHMGRYIIIFTMFLGRVGPLTLTLILAQREEAAPYRYAEERVKIG